VMLSHRDNYNSYGRPAPVRALRQGMSAIDADIGPHGADRDGATTVRIEHPEPGGVSWPRRRSWSSSS
jgi:hypothetical protein